ncbi:MAG TPA: TonB-dependent receptor [Ignavibacteria bacterium]|nr:TonB-dependent receptor [Ignavibacteria bacterium]HRA99223.1 TonB-dependent receptor [Ignavibacteria bacterium]
MKKTLLIFLFILFAGDGFSQELYGTIRGTVTDSLKIPLDGVVIKLKGTYLGSVTDIEGKYTILDVSPGNYTMQVSAEGFRTVEYTDLQVESAPEFVYDIILKSSSYSVDQEIEVVGDRPLMDIEQTSSSHIITSDDISKAIVNDVTDIITQQAGVVKDDNEIHIRGGRSYENSYIIDGVSVQDPLSGTGYGLQLSANSLEEVEVITGGYNAEYGQATSGVVNVRTKEGRYDEVNFYLSYKRDNFGVEKNSGWSFNTDILEMNVSGPEPITKYLFNALGIKTLGEITLFGNLYMGLSDGFYVNEGGDVANQLNSSIFGGTKFAPRQDNNWYWNAKATWRLTETMKLNYSFNQSVAINQNSSSLQTNLEYIEPTPGYQYEYQEILDNAGTYTQNSMFNTISWTHTTSPKSFYEIKLNNFFTQLRQDANGVNWTDYTEPFDVTKPPFQYYYIDSLRTGLIPGNGFYDVGSPYTWHDHFVNEYSAKFDYVYNFTPKSKLKAGVEASFQEMQLVDIYQPWIKPFGLNNDAYQVYPSFGDIYGQHSITFKGMILNYGLRLDYWLPGKYVDDAVNDTSVTNITPQIRAAYYDDSYTIFGRQVKFRLAPRVGISHPITNNQTLFFSYGHFSKRPKPQFVYAKINPQSSQSTFQKYGNPNLNPETTVAYELGIRNQFTNDDVFTVTAYYKNIYDYVATKSIRINSGRLLGQSFITYFNQDYARSRGIEIEYKKRVGSWFNGRFNFAYSVATGKSASSDQGFVVATTGGAETISETYLPWDRPVQASANLYFNVQKGQGLFGVGRNILDDIIFKARMFFQSGKRYTEQIYIGELESGRPEYEADVDNIYGKVGANWFWVDLDIEKYFPIYSMEMVVGISIKNVFNTQNSTIINPVTGEAYEYGQPTPNFYNDPLYPDLQAPLIPYPYNPSRYLTPRNILFTVSLKM